MNSDTYKIKSEGSAFVFTGGKDGTVTLTKMSDGTYRVEVTVANSGAGRATVSEALKKTFGVREDIVDGGISGGASDGIKITYVTTSKDGADALIDVLRQGTPSLFAEQFSSHGTSVESLTLMHPGATVGADGSAVYHGVPVTGERHDEVTFASDVSVTHRSVTEETASRMGWSEDGQCQVTLTEVARDAVGHVTKVVIEMTSQQLHDTRSGLQKSAETALELIPVVVGSATGMDVSMKTTTCEFERGSIAADVYAAVSSNNSAALCSAASHAESYATVTRSTYSGYIAGNDGGLHLLLGGSVGYGVQGATLEDSTVRRPAVGT